MPSGIDLLACECPYGFLKAIGSFSLILTDSHYTQVVIPCGVLARIGVAFQLEWNVI